jgi:hypothetical protein
MNISTIGVAIASILLGSVVLFATPTFATEPDVDSAAGPELPAPRTADPDFQQDDQPAAVLDPEAEGANPTTVPPPPNVVIGDPEAPLPE